MSTNTIHSTGAPDGVWYWQVRAIDAGNVQSAWSPIWNMTIDSTPEPVDEAEITNLDAYYKVDTYKGIGLDISVDNLTNATGVEVRTTRSNGADVVKTSKDTGSVLGLLNTGNAATVTAPIVIQQGTYNEAGSSSWNQPTESWDDTTVPETITVTITRSVGTPLIQTINISEVGESFGTLNDVMPTAVVQLAVTNETTGETFADLQTAIDDTDTVNGNSLRINENLTITTQINVTKALNIRGLNHTISANFTKVDNGNNAIFGIIGTNGVTLRGMKIDGTGGTNLHGVNVYESTGVLLRNLTVTNNDYAGVVVGGSTVTLDTINTSGNGWYGVNADTNTSSPTVLTVKGISIHNEGTLKADIYVDDAVNKDVTVNDIENQYDITGPISKPNDRVYKLKVVLPPDVTVEVTASNTEGWIPFIQTGAEITFVEDVETSYGDGALNMKTADDNNSVAAYYREVNVDLNDVFGLAYNTKQLQGPEGSANPSYYIGFDKDGDLNTADVSYALYETYYNGTNIAGVWQNWQMNDTQGLFWSSAPVGTKGSNGGGGSYAGNFTLGELKAAYPNAKVVEYGLNMGTYNPDWESLVDGFKFNETTYDFEPTAVVADTTAPSAPVITTPTPEQVFTTTPILNDWTDSTDDTSVDHYQIEYIYDDEHTFPGGPFRETTVSQRNHAPGINEQGGVTIRVRAFDAAGNASDWSNSVHYVYDVTGGPTPDTTDPVITISSPTDGQVLGASTLNITGTVTDENPRYHYCYLTTNQVVEYNGTTYTPGQEVGVRDASCVTAWSSTNTDGNLGGIDMTGLPNGSYTINVVAYDTIGNNNADAPVSVTFNYDTTATSGPGTSVPALDGNPSARTSSRRVGGFSTAGTSTGRVLGAESYNFTLLLKRGSRGTEVMELQKFLNAAGYNSGVEDGIFGPITEAAVKAFQLANGLVADGIVGPLTRAVLNA